MVHVAASGQRIIAKLPGTLALTPGSTVGLDADRSALHLFGADGASLRRGGQPSPDPGRRSPLR